MKALQNQENLQIRKCQTHQSCEIEYILVNKSTNLLTDQLGLCYKCIPSLKIHGCNLILCKNLIKESKNEILQNWPPLIETCQIKDFENDFKSKTQENAYEAILQFFDDFQNEFAENMQNAKKMILSTLDQKFKKKETILQRYNEIIQREKLQQLVQDYYYQQNATEEELKQFIGDFQKNKQENSEKFKNLHQECNFDEFPNLDVYNKLKDMMNILIKQISLSFGKFDEFQNLEILEQKIFQVMSLFKYKANLQTNEDFLQISKQVNQSKSQILDFLNTKNIFEKEQNYDTQKLTQILQNYKQIQNQMRETLKINKNLINKSNFISSNEKYNKIDLNIDGFLKITNEQPYQQISIFFLQPILQYAKYTIKIELFPFQQYQNNYSICLGVFNNLNKNSYFLSNKPPTIQQKAEKGSIFNNSSISFSPIMRKLELQIILKEKYFRLTDYPSNENIIIANKDSLNYQLNDLANLSICFQFSHIQFMHIVEFKQEIILDENYVS
ncbi:hypothetical protein ABPG74_017673 [Tetrahymena malaccensis]